MKLQVVIPALNEEESIRSIIERSLEARAYICANSPVTDVAITVVSDGSTDRTVERAQAFGDAINLIIFPKNRGYGAAIMEGWRQSDADLLAFLDADGTCEPKVFAPLCQRLADDHADIVLGCRLNKDSQMPAIRRFGNILFASLLTAFSLTRVRDTASGMRVVRRSALPKLMPLPTGLHFTPAMSARAILSRDLRISEVDMPYHERAGESKLHPVRDGFRFLNVIIQTAFLHRPSRPLGLVATVAALLAAVIMIFPAWFYAQHGRVEEWMIYRFIVAELLGGGAVLLWCASYLGRKAVDVALSDRPIEDKYHGLIGWVMGLRHFWLLPTFMFALGAAFVARAFIGYVQTAQVFEHWTRFIAMSSCVWIGGILAVTRVLDHCLNLLAERLQYMRDSQRPHTDTTAARTGAL